MRKQKRNSKQTVPKRNLKQRLMSYFHRPINISKRIMTTRRWSYLLPVTLTVSTLAILEMMGTQLFYLYYNFTLSQLYTKTAVKNVMYRFTLDISFLSVILVLGLAIVWFGYFLIRIYYWLRSQDIIWSRPLKVLTAITLVLISTTNSWLVSSLALATGHSNNLSNGSTELMIGIDVLVVSSLIYYMVSITLKRYSRLIAQALIGTTVKASAQFADPDGFRLTVAKTKRETKPRRPVQVPVQTLNQNRGIKIGCLMYVFTRQYAFLGFTVLTQRHWPLIKAPRYLSHPVNVKINNRDAIGVLRPIKKPKRVKMKLKKGSDAHAGD